MLPQRIKPIAASASSICMVPYYDPIDHQRGHQSQSDSEKAVVSLSEKDFVQKIYGSGAGEPVKVSRTPWSHLEYEIFKKGSSACDKDVWAGVYGKQKEMALAFDLQQYLTKNNVASAFTSVNPKGYFSAMLAAALSKHADQWGKDSTIARHGFNHPYIPHYDSAEKIVEVKKLIATRGAFVDYESLNLISASPSLQQCSPGESFISFVSGMDKSAAFGAGDDWDKPSARRKAAEISVRIPHNVLEGALEELDPAYVKSDYKARSDLHKVLRSLLSKMKKKLKPIFENYVKFMKKAVHQGSGKNVMILVAFYGKESDHSGGSTANLNDSFYISSEFGRSSSYEIAKKSEALGGFLATEKDRGKQMSSKMLKDSMLEELEQMCDVDDHTFAMMKAAPGGSSSDGEHLEEAAKIYPVVFESNHKTYFLSHPSMKKKTDRQTCGVTIGWGGGAGLGGMGTGGGDSFTGDERQRQIRIRPWSDEGMDPKTFTPSKSEYAMKAFRIVNDAQRKTMNITYQKINDELQKIETAFLKAVMDVRSGKPVDSDHISPSPPSPHRPTPSPHGRPTRSPSSPQHGGGGGSPTLSPSPHRPHSHGGPDPHNTFVYGFSSRKSILTVIMVQAMMALM